MLSSYLVVIPDPSKNKDMKYTMGKYAVIEPLLMQGIKHRYRLLCQSLGALSATLLSHVVIFHSFPLISLIGLLLRLVIGLFRLAGNGNGTASNDE